MSKKTSKLKFSIITPSLGRSSLLRTCKSINEQTYDNWQHIVMLDIKGCDMPDRHFLNQLIHPNRIIKQCEKPHMNYGNTCRHNAYEYCSGDYIGYCDDDDYFIPFAFEYIADALQKMKTLPNAIVFPALRHNVKFFNIPPAICMTVTGQYMHKPKIKGKEVRWINIPVGDRNYCYDGQFIENIKKLTKFTPICQDYTLVIIPSPGHAK